METTIIAALLGVLGGALVSGVTAYVVCTSLFRDFERNIPSNTVTSQRVDELQSLVETLAAAWRKQTMRTVRAAATNAPSEGQAQPKPFSKEQLRRELGRRLAASKGVQ